MGLNLVCPLISGTRFKLRLEKAAPSNKRFSVIGLTPQKLQCELEI